MSAHNVRMEGFMTANGQSHGMMVFNFDTKEEVIEFKNRVIATWQQMIDEKKTEIKTVTVMSGKVESV